MERTYRNKLLILGAAVGAAAAVSATTSIASASPDQTGKTFSEAQAALKAAGLTPVASTVIGDKTAQGDCKVLRQHDLPTGINWPTSQTTGDGIFIGGDQPTLYPITLPNIPTSGRVFLTLSCYGAKDAAAGQATGSGDITTKPPSS
ncbi:MAG: PASTA domain-containing protein [Mycobacteriaceae bacterium]|nr:PASTA domain-containing protein [Mycobacteriaceae bacterium]